MCYYFIIFPLSVQFLQGLKRPNKLEFIFSVGESSVQKRASKKTICWKTSVNSNINVCELWRANDYAHCRVCAGSYVLASCVCLDLLFWFEYSFYRISAKCLQAVVQIWTVPVIFFFFLHLLWALSISMRWHQHLFMTSGKWLRLVTQLVALSMGVISIL